MKKNASDLRIFALRRQGNTLSDIAQAVGLSPSTVRDRLLQSGQFPGRVHLRNHFPQDKVREVVSMRDKGASLRQIGAEIGYSCETVRTVLRKSGRNPARPIFRCSISGCKGRHYAHGYCQMHWARARNGRMDAKGNLISLHRFCSRCGRTFFSPPAPPSAQKCDGCRWKPPKKTRSGGTQAKVRKLEPIRSFQPTMDHSISNGKGGQT
jgi:lambda repressor-like predicted transcriptional regulator